MNRLHISSSSACCTSGRAVPGPLRLSQPRLSSRCWGSSGRTKSAYGLCESSRVDSRRSRVVARVSDVNQAAFQTEVLQASETVLVDFWAPWCGPCKLVAPLMDWAEKEYGGKLKVVKIEHDSNPELITKYKVYGLPTLLLFKNGAEVAGSKREGAVNKVMLQKYLTDNGITA